MDQRPDITKLLALRKVTRAISDLLGHELEGHLSTLSPLLQPETVLGKHVKGSARQTVLGADQVFDRLKDQYASLTGGHPFKIGRDLDAPLSAFGVTPRIAEYEYTYSARTDQGEREITVTAPLRWILCYRGFEPERIRQVLRSTEPGAEGELRDCVIHTLLIHLTLESRPGIGQLFESMRFPITTGHEEGLGALPITYVQGPVHTSLPPDEIIVQSTEISGTPAFQEVLAPDAMEQLDDPLRARLVEIASEQRSS